jgi:hypothetical protein|nr:MAG TPA: hypothetical protein [Caudoviricetes sp.]
MNEKEVMNLMTSLYNQMAKKKLTFDEAVGLNLSLIVFAYKKNGGTKQAIPLLVRNVSEYLTEALNDMIE